VAGSGETGGWDGVGGGDIGCAAWLSCEEEEEEEWLLCTGQARQVQHGAAALEEEDLIR